MPFSRTVQAIHVHRYEACKVHSDQMFNDLQTTKRRNSSSCPVFTLPFPLCCEDDPENVHARHGPIFSIWRTEPGPLSSLTISRVRITSCCRRLKKCLFQILINYMYSCFSSFRLDNIILSKKKLVSIPRPLALGCWWVENVTVLCKSPRNLLFI